MKLGLIRGIAVVMADRTCHTSEAAFLVTTGFGVGGEVVDTIFDSVLAATERRDGTGRKTRFPGALDARGRWHVPFDWRLYNQR